MQVGRPEICNTSTPVATGVPRLYCQQLSFLAYVHCLGPLMSDAEYAAHIQIPLRWVVAHELDTDSGSSGRGCTSAAIGCSLY